MEGYFPNILPKITELCLGRSDARFFSPPPNIVDLTLPYLQLNDLSHIAHLRLTKQQHIGRKFSDYDWANLVSLDFYVTITDLATSPAPQIIFFPRLETIITRGAYHMALAHFSAPRITDLQFDKMHYSTQRAVEGLEQLLSCPFFTLSPSETIDVLFPLNKRTLGNLVRAFSQTKRIKLRFEDEYDRWETTSGTLSDWKNEGGLVVEGETDAATSRSAVFMGKFTSLDIQFSGKYREAVREFWRARMVEVLVDTQDTQLKDIRCTWKGELPLELNRSELKAGDGVSEKVL
ncbi:hypothetical protein FS842_001741 [Serendipita sp. 407]|nr:hypothetical protein FS842_001741 [Serendipita sp. 407]